MPRNAQKAIWYTFAAVTVIMVTVSLYTYNYYFGVFQAMRTLQLSISDFNFRIVNSTQLVANTTVTLNNTSPYEFYALGMTQRVFLNNMFVGTTFTQEVSKNNPMCILPQSSKSATITLSLDLIFLKEELVELLLEPSSEKTWQVFIDASLEGPLVGKFSMDTAQRIGTS